MNHSDAAIAALYDHEQETARERERHAPDWGGDELFSSSPRRRFARGAHHALPRTGREGVEWRRPALAAPAPVERAPRRGAALTAPPADERAARVAALEALENYDRPELDDGFERSPSGRRTVTVTGHPDRRARSLAAGPRRPSPTVDQRLAHRPDRIAALAFGLGMLLILVAILTAHG